MDEEIASSMAGEIDAQSRRWKIKKKELFIVYMLALMSLMVALDGSIIITSLPYISQSLSSSSTQSFWVGTSYVLANAVSQLPVAALSSVLGRRQLYIPSLLFFAVGSIIAAEAHSTATLLVGRSIQGIGGGGITVMTMVIITDLIPLRERPNYISINSLAWAIGNSSGPLVGGALSQHSTWRWVFWLMLPFCGLGLAFVPLVIRLRTKKLTVAEKLRSFDWLGSASFTLTLTSFLVAISWGGSQYPWRSAATLVPLVVGGIGVILTLIWELRFSKVSFFRRSLFQSISAVASFLGAIAQGLLLSGPLYCLLLYFSAVKGHSATSVGVDLLPSLVTFFSASIGGGMICARTGYYRWTIWTGWVLITLGYGLTIMWDAETRTVVCIVILAMAGLGQGLTLTGLSTATQTSVSSKDAANAGSMYTFCRQLGAAFGIPIVTSTFQSFMRTEGNYNGIVVDASGDVVGYVQVLHQLPSGPEKDQLITAYTEGFRGTYKVCTGIAGLGLLLSLLVRHKSMDQAHKSEHVLAETKTPPIGRVEK